MTALWSHWRLGEYDHPCLQTSKLRTSQKYLTQAIQLEAWNWDLNPCPTIFESCIHSNKMPTPTVFPLPCSKDRQHPQGRFCQKCRYFQGKSAALLASPHCKQEDGSVFVGPPGECLVAFSFHRYFSLGPNVLHGPPGS